MMTSPSHLGLSDFLPLIYGLASAVLSIGIVVATAFVAFSYLPLFSASFTLLAAMIVAMWVYYGLERFIDSAQPKPVLTKHESYSPYEYAPEQDCTQIAICTRCGDRQNRIVHTYDDLEYESSDACRKVAACKRCGDITSSTSHTFDEGNYMASDACDFLKLCTRCGAQEGYLRHQFKGEKDADEVVCQRCGVVEHRERGYSDRSRNIMYDAGGIRYM